MASYCIGPCPALFGTREMIGHNLTRFREWEAVMTRSQAEFARARDNICAPGQSGDCTPVQPATIRSDFWYGVTAYCTHSLLPGYEPLTLTIRSIC